ncbi:MAG: IS91 family transposase [Solirubrobacterales bacterium]|nr:IS91 family transposase [Solirubrobacterales bacterium]
MRDPDPRTTRPRLELADVLRRHAEDYIRRHDGHLGRIERRVMSAIMACRTAVLGGHVETCTACRASRIAYNSCRNRHCPKCQGPARTRWLAARQRELLPVPYFHVVFTVPAPIGAIAFQNKAVVYAILFKAAAEALTTLAANPRRLGAEIGALAVLHTWGQALTHHPHLHCVVPGGGLALDGARWVHGRANFFLAVKPLARLFRRLFLDRLAAAFDQGELRFFGDLAALADRDHFAGHLASLRRIDWVVYAKKPFGGPAQVLAYLGRYTHRVAIANSRLVAYDRHHVAFTWKDYRRNGAAKVMRLTPAEFIRRFLLHTLPDGFHRIRHFGFLANGHRAAKLALARALLKATSETEPADAAASATAAESAGQAPTNRRAPTCSICGGIVCVTSYLPAGSGRLASAAAIFRCDTS